MNKIFKQLKPFTSLLLLLVFSVGFAQEKPAEGRQINIVYGANFTKDEAKFPGASIFSKDEERQVQFEHQGADLWCDVAVFYAQENRLRAIGNVRLQQGDSIEMNSGKLDYNGNTKLARAYEAVDLSDQQMTLTTDTLYFDREKQESYYKSGGKVVDSANVLTSIIGTYFMELKKVQFQKNVHIDNPEYVIDSEQLNYYRVSKNAYMYGPSTITGEAYKIYCERGFYDTKIEQGYGVKNTRIDYSNRIIEGDSVYFDKASSFASATNNIKVTDTVNNGVIRAHYAEVFKDKDSVFATKRAVAINLVQQDSLYIHGDTLMVTGQPENRILRAFSNAKFYKTDMSGKCDSIHSSEKTGITQLITNPVLWNMDNQMTGDSIHLLSNLETEELDSLKVINNAFISSFDTIGKQGYNQAKGKDLLGKFIENELKIVDLIKNTEVIYYMYNDDNELIGIDKTISSKIRLELNNSDIENITFFVNPEGKIYPEKDLPLENRKLKGFIWRGDERIYKKEDIFDEDDNNIVLVKIRGIDAPIDIDAEESERSGEPLKKQPINAKSNSKATNPTKSKVKKAVR
ncbi:OstA-like protein [Flavobacterium sp. ASW18X]|uniref:OstA-like protein n=1 Tax=Flavobacterium sp. ASW18X TaxID=2572595 RepID=UPI0010AE4227|nr:OstA-like protein [Flavobacterium sp. ASW18X]TKD62448.1 OstA-like protein [Flavobacterium sp. ASW18X]